MQAPSCSVLVLSEIQRVRAVPKKKKSDLVHIHRKRSADPLPPASAPSRGWPAHRARRPAAWPRLLGPDSCDRLFPWPSRFRSRPCLWFTNVRRKAYDLTKKNPPGGGSLETEALLRAGTWQFPPWQKPETDASAFCGGFVRPEIGRVFS